MIVVLTYSWYSLVMLMTFPGNIFFQAKQHTGIHSQNASLNLLSYISAALEWGKWNHLVFDYVGACLMGIWGVPPLPILPIKKLWKESIVMICFQGWGSCLS